MSAEIPKNLKCKLFCVIMGGSFPSVLREAYVDEETGHVNIAAANIEGGKAKADVVNMILVPNEETYADGKTPQVLSVAVAHEILIGTLEQIVDYQRFLLIRAAKDHAKLEERQNPEIVADHNNTLQKLYAERWGEFYMQYIGDGGIGVKIKNAMDAQPQKEDETMTKKTVEFEGEASGNGECAFWLIDWETLKRIDPEGAESSKEDDEDDEDDWGIDLGPLEQRQFPYYPERLTESGKRYKVKIEIEEIPDGED